MSDASKSARFRWLYDNSSDVTQPDFDQVVLETRSFVVVPSLGSLVAGWLLIVPKRPLANFSMLRVDEYGELNELTAQVISKLQIFNGKPQFFEHGGPIGSSISCGVDQAHLHVVPLQFDLVASATARRAHTWQMIGGIQTLSKYSSYFGEYLFVSDNEKAYFSKVRRPTSQWFRRLIAEEIGVSEQWNYREYPMLDTMKETVTRVVA